jgi:small multidrug resistance pump
MTAWLLLLVAIVFEVAGTTAMKLSEGFSRPLPSVAIFVCYAFAFVALTFVLRQLEVSIAYAVWAGLGTALIAVIGIVFFGESVTPMKLVSLLLVVAGVVGLNLSGSH